MTFSKINMPNFFLLGAGRSGSTYLYYLLKQHPDIFMTEPKEPTFFCEQYQVIKDPIDYFRLYDSATNEIIRGEASHAYLSNPTTARVLRALFPESKFVVILRNPVDRAYSLYHWMRRHGYEPCGTFESALKVEEYRYNSSAFKHNCPHYFYNSLYFKSGLYGEQLQRYFELFPKQQFYIVKYEGFINNPNNYLRHIFQFLGVSQNFCPEFNVDRNEGTKTSRFPGIHYYIYSKLRRHKLIRKISMALLKVVNKAEIKPLSLETRRSLMDSYSSDLQLLFDMTGIVFPAQ
ncbi:MAG: sulfotransferase [Gammaproteobacteria bacterium]|nr:sulfotransferase [Gammaproteobacteria bacterium]